VARRKSADERSQERYDAERRALELFLPKLEALVSWSDGLQLMRNTPSQSDPGRKYYANLGFFMDGFRFPAGAGATELGLYVEWVRRMDAAGELKAGALPAVEQQLRSNIQSL
jgi:hypothetical protein